MPDTRSLLSSLGFAALAVLARLPFLVTGKIPFDADEAVEGLMARHVLNGEFPAFFWGQAFKGVPEVYAAAGAFALFGSNVVVLKSVTLAFFAAYVALNFLLLDRITTRWVTCAGSILLIASPPALVFWSLDASAEYIVLMLFGTILLHMTLTPGGATSPAEWSQRRRFAIGLIVGLGLWVHQLFVVYLLPLVILLAAQGGWWKRERLNRPNVLVVVLGGVAALYLLLGAIAFVTGGFAFQIGGMTVGVRTPQKMLRIGAAVAVLAAFAFFTANTSRADKRVIVRRWRTAMLGFLLGYLPVILYSIFVELARSPARAANLEEIVDAAPDIAGNIVPIIAGFKLATTARLPLPLAAALPGAAAVAAYIWSARRRMTREFFALFVVLVPLLFLASGAYLDTQSYRYLIPWYAGLSVAWAVGSLRLARSMWIASALVAVIAGVHAWQQTIWFRMLQPDAQSAATIRCLQEKGIKGGFAEYWTAYKLTFLSDEAIVIAPTDGVDRRPAYTRFVQELPPDLRADDAATCR